MDAIEVNQTEKKSSFLDRQWQALKYVLSIETALVYFMLGSLAFALAVGILKFPNFIGHYAEYTSYGALFSASLLGYRACRESLTAVIVLLIIGVGAQALMIHGVKLPVERVYFQGMIMLAIVGLIGCVRHKIT